MHFYSFVTNLSPTENNGALWSALAVLGSAVIASLIALIGHWVTRSNTKLQIDLGKSNAILSTRLSINTSLAQMRQSWINTLRDDLADFQTFIIASKSGEDIDKIRRLENRIKLRMNPSDLDYPTLKTCIDTMVRSKTLTAEAIDHDAYVRVCQSILKREWDKLRDDMKIV